MCIAFCCVFFTAKSQFGVNFRYANMNPQHWENQTGIHNMFDQTYDFGVDYWFRLKNYRIEFTPELYYSRSSTTAAPLHLDQSSFGFSGNTNFYIFDIIGDCDCPTFSKDGNFLTKGFFLSAAPIFEYNSKEATHDEDLVELLDNDYLLGFSVGAGVDIGILDLLTITPYIRYKVLPSSKWDDLQFAQSPMVEDESTVVNYLQFGVRLGFRPDYVREQNKFRRRRR